MKGLHYELALFAGAGGGILGSYLHGIRTVAAVEIEAYPRRVLLSRQRDGILPPFPIWDDVRTFRADNPATAPVFEELRAVRDRLIITGGFPCQDISAAGRGAGLGGAKSSMWYEMERIISEISPRAVLIENSPMLRTRGLNTVLGGLARVGLDAQWGVIGADDAGAPHKRRRMWIFANNNSHVLSIESGRERRPHGESEVDSVRDGKKGTVANNNGARELQQKRGEQDEWRWPGNSSWRTAEPFVGGVVHGVADGMDRIRALGNGQVPAVAALALELLT